MTRVGSITVDGRPVGSIQWIVGEDVVDQFIADADGYEPQGRGSSSPQGMEPQGGGHPSSHGQHGGASAPAPEHPRRPRHHHFPHHTDEERERAPEKQHGDAASHAGKSGDKPGDRDRPVSKPSQSVGEAIDEAAKAHGLSPSFMKSVASIESNMNPSSNADKRTQYKGLYQIGTKGKDSEWSRFGGGGNPYSAHDNAMAAARMFEANKNSFHKKFGRDPTNTEMYLMHQQGLGFYTRGAMTNIAGNLPAGARTRENMTHQGFEQYWGNQIARREAQFNRAGNTTAGKPDRPADGTVSNTTTPAAGSGRAPLNFMESHEGENQYRDSADLTSAMGIDPRTESWCADMTNAALRHAGIKGTGSAVANSFQTWGKAVPRDQAKANDVVVLSRGHGAGQTGGHVGIATGNSRMHNGHQQIEAIGGNTGHAVGRFWANSDDPTVMVRRSGGNDSEVAGP